MPGIPFLIWYEAMFRLGNLGRHNTIYHGILIEKPTYESSVCSNLWVTVISIKNNNTISSLIFAYLFNVAFIYFIIYITTYACAVFCLWHLEEVNQCLSTSNYLAVSDVKEVNQNYLILSLKHTDISQIIPFSVIRCLDEKKSTVSINFFENRFYSSCVEDLTQCCGNGTPRIDDPSVFKANKAINIIADLSLKEFPSSQLLLSSKNLPAT